MKMKRCTKCGDKKSLDEFYKGYQTKDGRCSSCKICKNVQRRACRAAKDPEKRKAQQRAYHAKNREKIKAQQRIRRAKDPEKRKAQGRARSRERRAKDPEKVNAQQRACRAKKSGKYRAYHRKIYHETKGIMTKYRLMIAENIIKNLMKGSEDGNKKTN